MKKLLPLLFAITLITTACGNGENPKEKDKNPTPPYSFGPFTYLAVPACTPKPAHPSCSMFDLMRKNNKSSRDYYDQAKPGSPPPPIHCDPTGLCSITGLPAGYKASNASLAESLRYIDLNNNQFLNISDKDAFETNTKWTIGMRDWLFLTNGGVFPGNIGITQLKGDEAAFKAFDLTHAKAIDDARFLQETQGINQCQQVDYNPGFPSTYSAAHLLNLQANSYRGFLYNYDLGTHTPKQRDGIFLVLKDCGKPGWFAKIRITKVVYDKTTKHVIFDLEYQVLK